MTIVGEYCIVRTYSAGAWAGVVISKKGKEVSIKNARRLWYWKGAASLSELAVSGVSCPSECKFPVAVTAVILTEVIEIIPATQTAKQSIEQVKPWTAR